MGMGGGSGCGSLPADLTGRDVYSDLAFIVKLDRGNEYFLCELDREKGYRLIELDADDGKILWEGYPAGDLSKEILRDVYDKIKVKMDEL